MAQPIPFTNKQASGLESLAGGGVVSMNVVTDALGAVSRRPGILAYSEAPAAAVNDDGINGLFCTDDGVLLASSAFPSRSLYKVQGGASVRLYQGITGTGRPTFAQTEMIVALAGGGEILKYERFTGATAILGGDPPSATHVIAHNSRLLANDNVVDRTKVRYSSTAIGTTDYSGLEAWSFTPPGFPSPGYFTAEARPDTVVAIHENTNNVFVFGTGTTQVYGVDPSAIYLPESTREYGCGAPYSIIKQDQAFAWLDQYRRFIVSDGRSYKDISDPISKTIDSIADVSDCFGYRVLMGNVDALVWTFPSDGRTFAYQIGSGWGQWSGHDPTSTAYQQLPITSHFLRTDSNVNVVGLSDGRVAKLDEDTSTDLGDTIRAHVETGYINRGTDRPKHCQCVRLSLRRGETTSVTGPQALLSYRDNPGPWSPPIAVDLGVSGDTHPVLEFRSLGTYRRRQWRFEFTGTDKLTLVSATEDFEVLEQ